LLIFDLVLRSEVEQLAQRRRRAVLEPEQVVRLEVRSTTAALAQNCSERAAG
jgi:hypothetical protein